MEKIEIFEVFLSGKNIGQNLKKIATWWRDRKNNFQEVTDTVFTAGPKRKLDIAIVRFNGPNHLLQKIAADIQQQIPTDEIKIRWGKFIPCLM